MASLTSQCNILVKVGVRIVSSWINNQNMDVFFGRRTWTYWNVEQPPRVKRCHDCDKLVLQLDHHCVWLGNCIGQGNYCQFWWYLCEETAVYVWFGFLYISQLTAHITMVVAEAIMILLLIARSISIIFLLLLLLSKSIAI